MADIAQLATPGVRSLRPYEPGKPLQELEREYGVTAAIKLASNENPLGPGEQVMESLRQALQTLPRYPDANGFDLKVALADKHQVDISQITLGNGSSEVLEFVLRVFASPEHEVVFYQHAFAMYPISTQAIGARAVVTPAIKDPANGDLYGHDLSAMADAITDKTRVVFIANPNNPTGTWIDANSLHTFINKLPEHVMVVIDEAYYEYARDFLDDNEYPETMNWLQETPNLVVTRTFSKAYGLAGLRIGYSVSSPEVADLLNRVRPPFNVNALALVAAEAALSDQQHLARSIALNHSGRVQLCEAFDDMGLVWLATAANFVLLDVGRNGAEVYEKLLYHGVIVRPVDNYNLPNHLRVSIGLEQENRRFIEALKEVLKDL